MGGVYFTDGTDEGEDEGLLQPQETLEEDLVGDVLDTGYSPAERPWGVDDWGTTGREESAGESLDGRLARELPDGPPDEEGDVLGDGLGDGLGDVVGTDGELRDDEVGDERAGRLADDEDDDGGAADTEPQLWARDEGIDGAAASAEEAAVHVVRDDDR